jgi:hypothetical protein
VEQLELELREAREEASVERAERHRFEQRLQALLPGEKGARAVPERPSGHEPEFEVVKSAESAQRTPVGESWTFEQTRPDPAQGASANDSPTPEPPGNGQPPSAADEARPKESSGVRRHRSWRWRRRSSRPCAVCHRQRPALSDAELTESGWALSKSGAICATCQEHGWQFPADATVPFRRVHGRAE